MTSAASLAEPAAPPWSTIEGASSTPSAAHAPAPSCSETPSWSSSHSPASSSSATSALAERQDTAALKGAISARMLLLGAAVTALAVSVALHLRALTRGGRGPKGAAVPPRTRVARTPETPACVRRAGVGSGGGALCSLQASPTAKAVLLDPDCVGRDGYDDGPHPLTPLSLAAGRVGAASHVSAAVTIATTEAHARGLKGELYPANDPLPYDMHRLAREGLAAGAHGWKRVHGLLRVAAAAADTGASGGPALSTAPVRGQSLLHTYLDACARESVALSGEAALGLAGVEEDTASTDCAWCQHLRPTHETARPVVATTAPALLHRSPSSIDSSLHSRTMSDGEEEEEEEGAGDVVNTDEDPAISPPALASEPCPSTGASSSLVVGSHDTPSDGRSPTAAGHPLEAPSAVAAAATGATLKSVALSETDEGSPPSTGRASTHTTSSTVGPTIAARDLQRHLSSLVRTTVAAREPMCAAAAAGARAVTGSPAEAHCVVPACVEHRSPRQCSLGVGTLCMAPTLAGVAAAEDGGDRSGGGGGGEASHGAGLPATRQRPRGMTIAEQLQALERRRERQWLLTSAVADAGPSAPDTSDRSRTPSTGRGSCGAVSDSTAGVRSRRPPALVPVTRRRGSAGGRGRSLLLPSCAAPAGVSATLMAPRSSSVGSPIARGAGSGRGWPAMPSPTAAVDTPTACAGEGARGQSSPPRRPRLSRRGSTTTSEAVTSIVPLPVSLPTSPRIRDGVHSVAVGPAEAAGSMPSLPDAALLPSPRASSRMLDKVRGAAAVSVVGPRLETLTAPTAHAHAHAHPQIQMQVQTTESQDRRVDDLMVHPHRDGSANYSLSLTYHDSATGASHTIDARSLPPLSLRRRSATPTEPAEPARRPSTGAVPVMGVSSLGPRAVSRGVAGPCAAPSPPVMASVSMTEGLRTREGSPATASPPTTTNTTAAPVFFAAPLPLTEPATGPRLQGVAGRRGEMVIGAFLGGGACGKVYECLNTETGQVLAAKQIVFDARDPKLRQRLRQLELELEVLTLAARSRVRWIVGFHGAEKRGHSALMYLEYCAHGSLLDYMAQGNSEDAALWPTAEAAGPPAPEPSLQLCGGVEGGEGMGGLASSARSTSTSTSTSTEGGCGFSPPSSTASSAVGSLAMSEATRPQMPPLSLDEVRRFTAQLVEALHFLHSRAYAHLDVKTANVLITAEGESRLADLGCAMRLQPTSTPLTAPSPGGRATDAQETVPYAVLRDHDAITELRGTALYMAPEMIRFERERIGSPADIWSLGCVVMEMATGCAPWRHVARDKLRVLFRVGSAREALPLPPLLRTWAEEGRARLEHGLARSVEVGDGGAGALAGKRRREVDPAADGDGDGSDGESAKGGAGGRAGEGVTLCDPGRSHVRRRCRREGHGCGGSSLRGCLPITPGSESAARVADLRGGAVPSLWDSAAADARAWTEARHRQVERESRRTAQLYVALADFVSRCVCIRPDERGTAEELLHHPFLTL